MACRGEHVGRIKVKGSVAGYFLKKPMFLLDLPLLVKGKKRACTLSVIDRAMIVYVRIKNETCEAYTPYAVVEPGYQGIFSPVSVSSRHRGCDMKSYIYIYIYIYIFKNASDVSCVSYEYLTIIP